MMESKHKDWIARWAQAVRGEDYESRLRETLSTPRARRLLKWFRESKIPPDGLAYCLVYLSLGHEALRREFMNVPAPRAAVWIKGAQQCLKTAQWLRKYALMTDLPDVTDVCGTLEKYADDLHTSRFLFVTEHGIANYEGARVGRSESHRKSTVIAFLRAYFILAGDRKRSRWEKRQTWKQITNVLILSDLVPAGTDPKQVATVWNNKWKRYDVMEEVKFLADIYRWFLAINHVAVGGGDPTACDGSFESELAKYYVLDS
jgi:hypothetical protein